MQDKVDNVDLKHFVMFTQKIGEDEPILTSIFFQWLETTTRKNKCLAGPLCHSARRNFLEKTLFKGTRWAPTSYKYSYNPYKWPYKWVTGVITLLIGVITPFITGRGPTLYEE